MPNEKKNEKKPPKQTNKQIKQNETKTKTKDKKTQPCEQLTVKNELSFSNLVIKKNALNESLFLVE
jgi:hypothetical protein